MNKVVSKVNLPLFPWPALSCHQNILLLSFIRHKTYVFFLHCYYSKNDFLIQSYVRSTDNDGQSNTYCS